MIEVTGELDYSSAYIRLKEPGKSKDKAECKATDSRAWANNAMELQRQDFRGVIDPLLSWRESISHKRG
ncbi:hypothetical protein GW17_00049596 [Ensete ventricosum]|nr:hypothetical protein GW17_00049596 [Ensete ventricosum]